MGSALSDVGNGLYRLALPWMAYDLSHSAFVLAAVATLQSIPGLLLPIMGQWLDRIIHTRKVIVGSGLLQAMLIVCTVGLEHMHLLQLGFLYVVVGAMSVLSLLLFSATTVFISRNVLKEARVAVNSFGAVLSTITWNISPGIAGFFIQRWGMDITLIIDAGSFLFVLVPALFISEKRVLPIVVFDQSNSLHFKEFLAMFKKAPRLLWLTVFFIIWYFTWGGTFALTVFLLRQYHHLPANLVGAAMAIGGLFPIALGVLGPWLSRHIRLPWLIFLTLCVSGVGMILLGIASNLFTISIALGCLDSGIAPSSIALTSITQTEVPSHMYGRASGWQNFLMLLAQTIASMLAGIMAIHFGAPLTVMIFGALTIISSIFLFATPLKRDLSLGKIISNNER
ncbi:MAG: MFS transporter [Acidibacillus sp.]|nr:MFS transporter [Acidibacillus sp.]